MLQELQTTLNPNFSTPQNSVRQPRTSTQIYNIKEFIFNTSILSDMDTPASIQEAINGREKEAWKSLAKIRNRKFPKTKIMGEIIQRRSEIKRKKNHTM